MSCDDAVIYLLGTTLLATGIVAGLRFRSIDELLRQRPTWPDRRDDSWESFIASTGRAQLVLAGCGLLLVPFAFSAMAVGAAAITASVAVGAEWFGRSAGMTLIEHDRSDELTSRSRTNLRVLCALQVALGLSASLLGIGLVATG